VLTANPDKPVAEIVKEMGVTPALVYNAKASLKTKAGKRKRQRAAKVGNNLTGPTNSSCLYSRSIDLPNLPISSRLQQATTLLDELECRIQGM